MYRLGAVMCALTISVGAVPAAEPADLAVMLAGLAARTHGGAGRDLAGATAIDFVRNHDARRAGQFPRA